MKNTLILISFALISASIAYSQPKIIIDGGETYDWGKVTPKESPLKKDVTLRNTGNEKLIITEVKPSCGCTTAPLEKSDLNPGESTKIHVTYNVSSNSGPTSKTINITSNDPKNSRITYTLKAEVIRPIEISPTTFISFKDLEIGLESTASIKIRNTTDSDIKLSGIELSPPEMKSNLKENMILKSGKTYEIQVKLRPNKKGSITTRIKALTNNQEYPELIIHGYGNIKESPLFNGN